MSALAEKLRDKDDNEIHELMLANSLGYWCESIVPILDGVPFSFKHHEYLRDIYYDPSPRIVIRKAAQMGYSTYAILRSIHGCQFLYPKGSLYLFPNKDEVTDFSKTRFKRFLAENPVISRNISDTDTAHVKQIGKAFLYLRGARTRVGLKSIPVDEVIYDEYDEMEPKMVELAEHRLDHSLEKRVLKLSTPTIPEYGIDAELTYSNQKQWFIPCKYCGEKTCLEDEFPKCIEQREGIWKRVCKNCKREIFPADGSWEAKNPGSDISGYYISQLNSHFVSLQEIMKKWELGENISELYNSILGLPYSEPGHRLMREEVLSLCGKHLQQTNDPGPTSMGIDTGKELHVVIGKKISNVISHIIYTGKHRNWEDLGNLMTDFNVMTCVIDGLPHTQDARDFADKHRGKVFLRMAYNPLTMGIVTWNYEDFTVKANRTETLDHSHNLILGRRVVLPRRSRDVEEFAEHCEAITKKNIIDEDTKVQKAKWFNTNKPDHYRHAFNFWAMASRRTVYLPDIEPDEEEYKPFDPDVGY